MEKTVKEIAFLRGLTVEPEYTQRFTDFFDESVRIGDILTLTYLNAGAGNHAIEVSEALGAKAQVFPVCETKELADIAQLKADATKVSIDFSTHRPIAISDYVLTDGSLQTKEELAGLINDTVAASIGSVAVMTPTAGSFGEIFSILWEVLFELNIEGHETILEDLIGSLPTFEYIEELFASHELKKISSKTKAQTFDYENGKEFVESPLMQYFFFPRWLSFLPKKDKERVIKQLAQTIDADRQDMTFRFSVKATVTLGKHSD